jgi:subfamily B ATP-binding cassette protein MsbA
VRFHYEPDEPPALDDVSLTIPAGRTTALVGPSGAGKSTLVKLLFRFYDPDEGTVTVDGRPLPELALGSWRDRIALVSQDVFLFNATVRENIAYGRPGATDAEVEEAARRADAHAFIRRLPQGYDTELGDRGVRLSGGQQQRITLARAIVRNPELLILDEATNALDSRSERLIQDALDLFGEGRTVVIIAHRFSTIEQADHIVVLEGGRVREEGDRESLLAHEGLFSELLALQRGAVL